MFTSKESKYNERGKQNVQPICLKQVIRWVCLRSSILDEFVGEAVHWVSLSEKQYTGWVCLRSSILDEFVCEAWVWEAVYWMSLSKKKYTRWVCLWCMSLRSSTLDEFVWEQFHCNVLALFAIEFFQALYNCIVQWEIRIAFPRESQLRQIELPHLRSMLDVSVFS